MNSSSRDKDNNLFTPINKNYSRYLIFFIGVVMLMMILAFIPQMSKSNASTIKTNSLSARSVDEEINPLTLVQCSDTNLAAVASFDVGSSRTPYSIVTGDFDGDGVPDLATPNLTANTVSVLKNTSTTSSIGFAACSDFTVGSRPYGIAKGDIDGDGKLDIIATNNSSNTVSVLRNTSTLGTLSFTRSDFSVGTGPQAVEVGDIDGDGKLDLVVGNSSSKTVSVLRSTSSSGSISFAVTSNYTVSTNPSSIAIEDVDGDGKSDLAVAHYDYSANNLSVFRNTSSSGSISLATAVNFSVGTSPLSVTSGDIDGDGKKDLAVANNGTTTVSLLRNTSSSGSISFVTTSLTVGSNPRSVRIGDIDSDGKVDLVVANAGSMTVSTLRNTSTSGSISFATSVDVSVPSTSRIAVIEDIDGDGKLDLAVLNSAQYTIWILKNITTGSSINFLVASNFSTGTIPTSVAIGDIDGDGKSDLVVTNQNSNNVSVFLNTSSGSGSASFTRTDFSVGNLPTTVAIADLDGDGKLDLAVTNSSSNTVSVLVNTSNTGSTSFATASNFSVSTGPIALAIGDIDGDGKSDLVVANFSSNNISVLRNTSTGSLSFASPTSFSVGTNPISVGIGDIDGDGKSDVAVANQNSANISVLRNTSSIGSVSFAGATNFSVPIVPRSIAIGDLDGDNKIDLSIATASSSNNKISVLRNTSSSGSISFATRIEFAINLQPYSVVTVDADGDGKLDLAAANGATRTVSLLKNTSTTGTITFAYHNDFMVGNAPVAIGVADLDGNNKQDLAVVNAGSNYLTILLNNCTAIP